MPITRSFDSSSGQGRFTPKHKFVGRKDVISELNGLYENPQAFEEYRIFNVDGIGGQGKSSLADHFLSEIEPGFSEFRRASAILNFDTATLRQDPPSALLSIRNQLRGQGLIFPAFDTAYARYFSLRFPGRDLKALHPELFEQQIEWISDVEGAGGDILSGVSGLVGEVVSDIPGVGTISRNMMRMSGHVQRWWQRRGVDILQDLDFIAPIDVEARLPMFLAADICAWNEVEAEQQRRVTLVIDTYEALWRERSVKSGAESFEVDRWVRSLASNASGVMFFILGREPLQWEEVEPDWGAHISHWCLDELQPADVEELLLEVPIEEADVRAAITESSGCLPFYVKLQIDRYAGIKNQGGLPSETDFTGSQDQILGRFTDHLEGGMSQCLRIMSAPAFIHEHLFTKLADEFFQGIASVNYHTLLQYSFWKVEGPQGGMTPRFKMHELMQEHLQVAFRAEQQSLFTRTHEFLLEFFDIFRETIAHVEAEEFDQLRMDVIEEQLSAKFDARGIEEQYYEIVDFIVCGLHHVKQLGSLSLSEWFSRRGLLLEQLREFQLAHRTWHDIKDSIDAAEHPLQYATCLHRIGVLHRRQSQLPEAEYALRQALELREEHLEIPHEDTAHSCNSLAVVVAALGREQEAIPLYKKAIEIFEACLSPDHPEISKPLGNLADIFLKDGRLDEAESLYLRSYGLVEKALDVDSPLMIGPLNNLAGLRLAQDRREDAEELLWRAHAVGEDFGAYFLDEYRSVVRKLSSLLESQQRHDEAQKLHEGALAMAEEAFGADSDQSQNAMITLSRFYYNQGKFEETANLEEQLLETRIKSLGSEHFKSMQGACELAQTYLQLGRAKEAAELVQQVIDVLQGDPERVDDWASATNLMARVLESDHRPNDAIALLQRTLEVAPNVLQVIDRLAYYFYKQDRFAEAIELKKRGLSIREETVGKNDESSLFNLQELSSMSRQNGDSDQAEVYARQFLAGWQSYEDRAEQVYEAKSDLAKILHGQDKHAELAELLEQMRVENSDDFDASALLAVLLFNLDRPDESLVVSLAVLKKFGTYSKETLSTVENIVYVYARSGRASDAIKLIEEHLDNRPRDEELRGMVMSVADTFWQVGAHETSVDILSAALKFYPGDTGILDTLGRTSE